MAISGIYCIKNTINGKRYIGQSNDIKNRFRQHKSKLNNNKHPNNLLQNAWNKYGCAAFEFNVVEECSVEELNDKEVYYIQRFKTFGQGYNLSVGGDPGINSTGKRIKQYDLDGNYIKTWNNAAEASRFFNVDRSQITYAIRHHRTMHGYQWCYEYETINGYYSREKQKAIAQYDLQDNLIAVYRSLSNVLEKNPLFSKDNIWHSINGNWRQTAYGFKWKYITKEEYYAKC